MKNKVLFIIFIIFFSKLGSSFAHGNNLEISIADYQWYNSLYNNNLPTKNSVKIAIFGEEILLPNNMRSDLITYDPYLKKNVSPKEDIYTTDSTKILSIINNLNSTKDKKAKFSYLNVKIYKKSNILTEKILLESLDHAVDNKVNIIFLENSLPLQFIDSNNTLCKKVKALVNKNIAIITLAGNEFESSDENYFISKCKDLIKIAPLDNKLSLYANYVYSDDADYALPSEDFIVNKGYQDSVSYKVESNYQFAPALFTYILASEFARNYSIKNAIKNIDKITYLPYDNVNYGKGVISTNKNQVINKYPVIDNVVSDDQSSFVVTWKPPLVNGIKYYKINVYNIKNNKLLSSKNIFDNTAVRYKFEYKLNKDNYITLSAFINNKLYTSMPFNDYKVEKYKQLPDPYIEIKSATAEWVEAGIRLSIITNNEDPKTYINIALLDGWTQQVLYQDQSYKYNEYLIRVNPDDNKRFEPHIILLSLNNSFTRVALNPQYTLNMKFITAGKDKIALVGSTEFSCLYHLDKSGCKGAKINIINEETGEIVSSTKVLPDLTYNIVLPDLTQKIELFAIIEGTSHRSNTLARF